MKNGDLKRFYPRTPDEPEDFVRYDNNKNIKVGLAFGADDAMSKTATEEAIQRAQLSIYKPGGSKTFAQLPTPSEDYLGYVYNVTDAFTTDNRFIEGAGKQYPAGTNVAVIVDEETYYLDVWVGGEDYNLLDNIPIINQNLDDNQFVPQNGKYYRHIAASVEPQMTAFTVGQTLSVGDKIHFDTTKGDELATYLSGLTYDSGQYSLLLIGSATEYLMAINLNDVGGSGYILSIYNYLASAEMDIIYATETGSVEGVGSWTAGFNNLDENGDYTIALQNEGIISEINDTTPPTWNGIIIGTMEEAPASSFIDGVIYYYDDGTYTSINGQPGPQGEQGPAGPTGKDALVYGAIIEKDYDPVVGNSFSQLNTSLFNHTPSIGEYTTVTVKNTSNNKTFTAVCSVETTSATYTSLGVRGIVETTGAQGSAGETLNKYSVGYENPFGSTNGRKIYDIYTNARCISKLQGTLTYGGTQYSKLTPVMFNIYEALNDIYYYAEFHSLVDNNSKLLIYRRSGNLSGSSTTNISYIIDLSNMTCTSDATNHLFKIELEYINPTSIT